MRKTILLALLVVAGLCWSVPAAQEGSDEREPKEYLKHYSLTGIPLWDGGHEPRAEYPTPRLIDPYFGPSSRIIIVYGDMAWRSKVDSGVGLPLSRDNNVSDMLKAICPDTFPEIDVSDTTITMTGTQTDHDRFGWALERLRAFYDRKIRFSVVELAQPTQSGPVPAARAKELRAGSRPVATRRALPTELALVSAVKSFDYTSDYEIRVATSAAIHQPVLKRMHVGTELALSAAPTTDGALLVRCVRAHTRLRAVGTFDGHKPAGLVEQPDFDVDFEEGAVRLEKGESWVFGDRYLISATMERDAQPGWAPDGTFALLNPDFLMPRSDTELGITPGAYGDEIALGSVDEGGDFARSGPTTQRYDSVPDIDEAWDIYSDEYLRLISSGAEISQFGPLLCVRWPEDAEKPKLLEIATPKPVALNVRRWHVQRGTPIPDDLLEGVPQAASLEKLGTPVYSRRLTQFDRGVIEDYQLRLTNFVAAFDASTATGVAVYDTVTRTMVSGTRLTIRVATETEAGIRLDVMYAYAPPGKITPSSAVIPAHGQVQTATIASTALRMEGALKVGESMVEITPMPEDENTLIVLAITRVDR